MDKVDRIDIMDKMLIVPKLSQDFFHTRDRRSGHQFGGNNGLQKSCSGYSPKLLLSEVDDV